MRRGIQFVTVCLMMALAGCSTPGDVAKREPMFTASSNRTVDQVMGCLTPKIMEDMGMSKVLPIENGQQILVSGSALGQYLGSVSVTKQGEGSKIEVRQGASTDYAFKPTMQGVHSCI